MIARRWIRLLFGREFGFDAVITLWTNIFSNGCHLELYKWIFVAILESNRKELLSSDLSGALHILLKPDSKMNSTEAYVKSITMKAYSYQREYQLKISEEHEIIRLKMENVEVTDVAKRNDYSSPWVFVSNPKVVETDPLRLLDEYKASDLLILKRLGELKNRNNDVESIQVIDEIRGILSARTK